MFWYQKKVKGIVVKSLRKTSTSDLHIKGCSLLDQSATSWSNLCRDVANYRAVCTFHVRRSANHKRGVVMCQCSNVIFVPLLTQKCHLGFRNLGSGLRLYFCIFSHGSKQYISFVPVVSNKRVVQLLLYKSTQHCSVTLTSQCFPSVWPLSSNPAFRIKTIKSQCFSDTYRLTPSWIVRSKHDLFFAPLHKRFKMAHLDSFSFALQSNSSQQHSKPCMPIISRLMRKQWQLL
jgi:hypothetical protein